MTTVDEKETQKGLEVPGTDASKEETSTQSTMTAARDHATDDEELKEVALDKPESHHTGEAETGAPIEKTDTELSIMPTGPKLYLIVLSLMLAVFCVALDNTIIAVAIPKITDEFHNLNDVGWYASSYLLTTCAFQLLYGKFYTAFSVKMVFLVGLFIFEVGSLICAVAPDSTTFIVGRAIAGLGSAGIFTGALVTLAYTVPLEKRPVYFGMIGGMYGIASVAGPLMGGAFTTHATWRWCFYINLPLGGITAAGLIFLLKLPKRHESASRGWWGMFKHLDPLGTIIFVPAIVCLLLALQWGGSTYPWSNGRIIALFILFGVFVIVFIVLQIFLKESATVPSRIASQRTVAFSSLFALFIGASFFIEIYFIPIWFQAIKGVSALRSGVYSLPLILANVVAIVMSGGLVTRFGYFTPFFIASTVVMSIGAGLIYTWTVETGQAKWAGYQFLYGFGVGLGFQQGGVAAQAVLKKADVSIGTAVVLFLQLLGGSLFVSVAQNLFTNHLIAGLTALHIPGLNPDLIVHAGATNLRHLVGNEILPQVLVVYNEALVKTFQLALITSCLSILGAVGIEWVSVKSQDVAGAALG